MPATSGGTFLTTPSTQTELGFLRYLMEGMCPVLSHQSAQITGYFQKCSFMQMLDVWLFSAEEHLLLKKYIRGISVR